MVAWWLIAIELLSAGLVIALVVALVVTLAVVSAVVAVLVKDHKGGNHSRHPSAASEDESDEKRPAPLVDGTHPQQVRMKVMRNDPHPLSTTASGGKIIAKSTLKQDITL